MLKEAIKRRKPDFNESYYGFRAFGNLLEEAQKRGLLVIGRDEKSGTYVYRSNGGDAAAAEAAVELVGSEGLPLVSPATASEGATTSDEQNERNEQAGGRRKGQGRRKGGEKAAKRGREPKAGKEEEAAATAEEGSDAIESGSRQGQEAAVGNDPVDRPALPEVRPASASSESSEDAPSAKSADPLPLSSASPSPGIPLSPDTPTPLPSVAMASEAESSPPEAIGQQKPAAKPRATGRRRTAAKNVASDSPSPAAAPGAQVAAEPAAESSVVVVEKRPRPQPAATRQSLRRSRNRRRVHVGRASQRLRPKRPDRQAANWPGRTCSHDVEKGGRQWGKGDS